jgi:predicted 3-demethylubiquinone-9 3-methyltransferase (glyoxalase superfamily)
MHVIEDDEEPPHSSVSYTDESGRFPSSFIRDLPRRGFAMPKITPMLWFDDQAEQAAELYVSVFPNSKITHVNPVTVSFVLDGAEFTGLNGGPMFTFTEAVSFVIPCEDQAEVDHYWNALTADGGEESQCGWLKDRFGVSWQVTPNALMEAMSDPDPERAERARQAMFTMKKIDIAAIQRAADGA